MLKNSNLSIVETPPRTWRRRNVHAQYGKPSGNTSTDVEKTETHAGAVEKLQKHLHGRGEDFWRPLANDRLNGNTSTDVEKTPLGPRLLCRSLETPPRTWRRLRDSCACAASRGNTSTDVEKTLLKSASDLDKPETPPRTWRRQQDLALSYFSQHYHLWFYLIKGVPEPTGDH